MKRTQRQSKRRAAFTIIELLTVMSIIVILIGLLVPALNMVRRFAQGVRQHAQLHSIDAALELFNNEFNGYPDSSALDPMGESYCGAMKLSEAMLGQDMLGFHKSSVFRRDGLDAPGTRAIYGLTPASPLYKDNLTERKGPFLPLDNADVYRMSEIYGTNVGNFLPDSRVLCDVYSRTLPTGKKAGMPVLYYKADTTNTLHDPNYPPTSPMDSRGNIYNYWDNQELILLGMPWQAGGGASATTQHKMADYRIFYQETRSEKVLTTSMPRRPDTYILISAGFDGEYGTSDDICNYQKQ